MDLWALLVIAALGAYHGLNPAMSWLFAVALGMQDRDRGAVLRALPAIAIGHELSLVLVVAAVLGLGLFADPALLRLGAGVALIAFGIFRFARPRAHPRWTTMRVNRRELAWWSFLMSSAHGAGLMVAPVLIGGAATQAAAHDHALEGVRRRRAADRVARAPAARRRDGGRDGRGGAAGLRAAGRRGAAQGLDQPRRRVGGRLRAGGSANPVHVTDACSVLAERLGDDLAATAPKARRFLLLEQPGPWTGRNAVTHSDLDEGLARSLLALADEAGVKVHLIRRGSRRATLKTRACFIADTRREDPWIERHELRDPAEVLELDLGEREPQTRWDRPVYFICTHGKRDPCCARRGRPLVRAVRAQRPDETWEIGHIGGHRFAATFLAFPHGLCFGRVPAATGPRIVAGLEAGEIALEHLRGRAGDPPAVQAADVLVRRRLGLRGLDDLVVEHVDGAAVTVRTPTERLRAVVAGREAAPRPISCGDEPEPVTEFELADLSAIDRAA